MEKKPLLCRLHRHRWERRFNEDGQAFFLCDRCGSSKDVFILNDTSALF